MALCVLIFILPLLTLDIDIFFNIWLIFLTCSEDRKSWKFFTVKSVSDSIFEISFSLEPILFFTEAQSSWIFNTILLILSIFRLINIPQFNINLRKPFIEHNLDFIVPAGTWGLCCSFGNIKFCFRETEWLIEVIFDCVSVL